MILFVSPPDDDHTSAVSDLLRQRGHTVEVIDVLSISADTSVELSFGAHGATTSIRTSPRSGSTRVIDLAAATTGWWRRVPAPTALRSVVAAAEVDGSPIETTAALESATASLDLAWINDPIRDRSARRRPRTWSVASSSGLKLPETIVTSDRTAAHAFRDAHLRQGIVAKPLVPRVDDWTGCRTPYDVSALDEVLDGIAAEVVIQEHIPGHDARVISIDGRHFAAEFPNRDPELPLDFAVQADDGDARRLELPHWVCAGISALTERLGLVQAAIDLRITAEGEIYFLDIDPTPPWLLLEELTDWPITESVVGALAKRDAASIPVSGRSAALR